MTVVVYNASAGVGYGDTTTWKAWHKLEFIIHRKTHDKNAKEVLLTKDCVENVENVEKQTKKNMKWSKFGLVWDTEVPLSQTPTVRSE